MDFDQTQSQPTHAWRRFALMFLPVIVLALPAATSAAKPPSANNSQLSIAAGAKQITFGRSIVISGKLKGAGNAGVGIQLQINPFPYAGFVGSTVVNTDATGNFSTIAKPTVNSRFRVQTTTLTPAQTSGEVTVLVAPKVSLRLSDSTPATGKLVRFYGYVWPSHDGRTADLQRKTTAGSWQTVARLSLRDDGAFRSKYSRRVRVRKDGSYRVQLLADTDHATGLSAVRSARVH